jgi:hypothetical protein
MATKTKPRKAHIPAPRKGRGITIVSPRTPGATKINFASTEGATRTVEGTYADLIRDGHDNPAQWVSNMHADPKDNKMAFLVGRGWSATPERRRFLRQQRIPVMAINDYPDDPYAKPNYWCTGDPPGYFTERIWSDPEVMKFIGIHNQNNERPRDGAFAPKKLAKEAPNVWFFHHATNEMDTEHWLFHPFIAWGSTIGCEGGPKQLYAKGAARSSMLIGLKLLWFLGYRRIYLCGCDCDPHQHPAPEYYNTIFHLLGELAPHFPKWGLQVTQTNPESWLRCFPMQKFDEVFR